MPYPRLTRLRDDLLNHTNWPEGFEWEWDMCRKCAMGLLAWQEGFAPHTHSYYAAKKSAEILGLKHQDASYLFVEAFLMDSRLRSYASITPQNQADVITDWLEKQGG